MTLLLAWQALAVSVALNLVNNRWLSLAAMTWRLNVKYGEEVAYNAVRSWRDQCVSVLGEKEMTYAATAKYRMATWRKLWLAICSRYNIGYFNT